MTAANTVRCCVATCRAGGRRVTASKNRRHADADACWLPPRKGGWLKDDQQSWRNRKKIFGALAQRNAVAKRYNGMVMLLWAAKTAAYGGCLVLILLFCGSAFSPVVQACSAGGGRAERCGLVVLRLRGAGAASCWLLASAPRRAGILALRVVLRGGLPQSGFPPDFLWADSSLINI